MNNLQHAAIHTSFLKMGANRQQSCGTGAHECDKVIFAILETTGTVQARKKQI